MTDPSRYQRTDDPSAARRRVPRAVWMAVAVAVLIALVVAVVMLAGGHDLSQFRHG